MVRGKIDDQDVRDIYDRDPNLTLVQLSRITGFTIKRLKEILMQKGG